MLHSNFWLRVSRLCVSDCSQTDNEQFSQSVNLQGAFIKGGGGPGAFGRMSQGGVDPRTKEEMQTVQGGAKTWSNPTGRVSVQFAPGAVSHFSA